MKKVVISLMLLSASVTPAFANYFSNPDLGLNLNIGSAPNPTPQQLREDREPVVADVQRPAKDADEHVAAPTIELVPRAEAPSVDVVILAPPSHPTR